MVSLVPSGRAGVAFTGAYAFMIAANSVFIAVLVRGVSPAVLAFGALLLATAVFQVLAALRRSRARPVVHWSRATWMAVGWLNVFTAIGWLGLFYAVQFIRPSVNGMIVNAVGPLALALGWRWLRPEVPTLSREKLAAAGIGLSVVLLAGAALADDRAMVRADFAWAGVLIAFACGAVQTLTVLTNKRLIEQGIPITDILGSRFVLTIAVAGALAVHEGAELGPLLIAHLPSIAVLATTFVVLPAFTLQLGLQRAEPTTVTIILFSIPLITASLELLDPAIRFDPVTLLGVLIGFAAAVHGALARIGASRAQASVAPVAPRKEPS